MKTKHIIILALILVGTVGTLLYFESQKENTTKDLQSYEVIADMTSTDTDSDDISEIDILKSLIKKEPTSILFKGIDGKGDDNFLTEFSTVEICDTFATKEERRRWWKLTGENELNKIKAEFEEWKTNHAPFRAYAIAIDITDGWDGKFKLSDYLSSKDIQWIENNNSSVDVYAIGFNEVPGKRPYDENENIQTIERATKEFLTTAPKNMPETKLFQQLKYIFKNSYHKVFVKTDLMHHEQDFSAYLYDEKGVHNMADHFSLSVEVCPRNVIFSVESAVTGRDQTRQGWYDEFKKQIKLFYPKTDFQFKDKYE